MPTEKAELERQLAHANRMAFEEKDKELKLSWLEKVSDLARQIRLLPIRPPNAA